MSNAKSGKRKKRTNIILDNNGVSRILSKMAASFGIYNYKAPSRTGSISGLINKIAAGVLEVYWASKETSEPGEPGYYFAYFRKTRWVVVNHTGTIDVEVLGTTAPYELSYFTRWVKVPIPYCLRAEDLYNELSC